MKATSPMRAAIYTRVSSEMQADNWSLDAQAQACERLAVDRGYEIVARYSDVESARTTERPQFRRLLADAERRAFDVILVHKLDRFSRAVVDTLLLLKKLETWQVALVCVSEQFDFTTPVGKVLLTMLSAFAQWYLDNLSAETSKGKRARAERGMWNSMTPYGYFARYVKDGGDGLPKPDLLHVAGVRLAFEQYATGQYSDLQIAQLLNERGDRPQGRGKRALKLWSKDSVRYLLLNRFYLGEVCYGVEWFPGKHEAIISVELFARCEQVRASRRRRNGYTAKRTDRVYALSGVARCARCGSFMRATQSRCGSLRAYYRDPAREHGLDCDQRFVPAAEAEQALGAFLSDIVLPQDWQAQILQLVEKRTGPRVNYEAEKKRLDGKLERLRALFIMGDVSEVEYKRQRNAVRQHLSALHPPEMADLKRAAALLQQFGVIWQAALPQERKALVRNLLDAVYLDSERGPVVAILPKPAVAALFRTVSDTGTTGIDSPCGTCGIMVIEHEGMIPLKGVVSK